MEEDNQENLQEAPFYQKLPEEITDQILATVSRCDYPSIFIASNYLTSKISSQKVYAFRSQLGLAESVVYASVTFPLLTPDPRLFILNRKNTSFQLKELTSLPSMLPGSTAVTIGPKIFVIGGRQNDEPVNTVSTIDCRTHRLEYVNGMQRERTNAAAGVIDGNIYVVGGREKQYEDWVEVFNVEDGVWKTVPGAFPPVASSAFLAHAVMNNKIYCLDQRHCFVYDPKRSLWTTCEHNGIEKHLYRASTCVLRDCLCAFFCGRCRKSRLHVYSPRLMVWNRVKGIRNASRELDFFDSTMTNFHGNLLVLGRYRSIYSQRSENDVWCVEIALEERDDGTIWGNVEGISLVNTFDHVPAFEFSRTVTV